MNYFDHMAQKLFSPKKPEGIEVVEGDWKICPEDTLTQYIYDNLPNEGRK